MRALVAGVTLALLMAVPVVAREDPFLTLETAGPYHYGGTITVTAHGDFPGHPGDYKARTHIRMECRQPGHGVPQDIVWAEFVHSPAEYYPYTLHLGPNDPSVATSLWDLYGGGPADCTIDFYSDRETYTSLTIHVEA